MTLIRTHLSKKYNREKPVLIVGKGPTARFIPKSDEYYVACLNQSGRLVEHCDFQFIGDQKPYHDMLESYVERVDNLIFPTKFNLQNTTGDDTIDYVNRTLPQSVQKHAYTFCGPTVWHCHDFDFAMKVSVMCTGELSFYWLLKQGFKNFKSVGIDKNFGDNRRHQIFMSNGDCPDVASGNLFDGWEDFMFNRKLKLIKENNANWELI
jgi:hypothetical protein